jgi:hypothetical protein
VVMVDVGRLNTILASNEAVICEVGG